MNNGASASTFVLLAGLPGTGKSTLAAGLVKRLDAAVLSKDEVRRALFPGRTLDASREQNDIAMRSLLSAAAYIARQGRPGFIIIDGRTFSRPEDIAEVIRAAEDAGSPWRILHLWCEDEVALKRIEQSTAGHPATNRNAELYFVLKQNFSTIHEAHLSVDTGQSLEECLRVSLAYLLGETEQSPGAGVVASQPVEG